VDSLPEEVVIYICQYLPAESVVALSITNWRLWSVITECAGLVKRLCRELDSSDKQGLLSMICDRQDLLQGELKTTRAYLDFTAGWWHYRAELIDPDPRESVDSDDESTTFTQQCTDIEAVTEEKPCMSFNWWPDDHLSLMANCHKSQVEEGAFSYDFNSRFMVLVHSMWFRKVPQSKVLIWDLLDASLKSAFSFLSYVDAQDVVLVDNLLWVCPQKQPEGEHRTIIRVYNVASDQHEEVFKYTLGPDRYRKRPTHHKDPGARRVYHIPSTQSGRPDMVVVVLPLPVWTILRFKVEKLDVGGQHKIQLIDERRINEANNELRAQPFSSSSTDNILMLSFFGPAIPEDLFHPEDGPYLYETFVIVCKFNEMARGGDVEISGPIHADTRGETPDKIFEETESLRNLPMTLQATNYNLRPLSNTFCHNTEESEGHPVAVKLDEDGNLAILALSGQPCQCFTCKQLYVAHFHDWYTSEVASTIALSQFQRAKLDPNWPGSLLVHDQLAIVSQTRMVRLKIKRKEQGRKTTELKRRNITKHRFVSRTFVTCVNWQTGKCLWVISPYRLQSSKSPDATVMKVSLGTLWLGTSTDFRMVSLATGKVLKKFKYLPSKRWYPEIPQICEEDKMLIERGWKEEDDAKEPIPFVQSRPGIYNLRRLNTNKVLVVHDFERFTPLVFDLLELQ